MRRVVIGGLLIGLLAAAAVAAWALIGGVLDEVVGPGVGRVMYLAFASGKVWPPAIRV